MFLFPLTNSQWASFGRSTWLPPKFIQTPGHSFRPFACCAMSCIFTPLPLPFFHIIPLTPPNLFLGTPWSVSQRVFFSTPSLSLTRDLKSDFKEWLRLMGGADEVEILSLFDALPRKLPTRRLIGAYTKLARWTSVKGMSLYFCYRLVFIPSLLTLVIFLQKSWRKNHQPALTSWMPIGNGRPSEKGIVASTRWLPRRARMPEQIDETVKGGW